MFSGISGCPEGMELVAVPEASHNAAMNGRKKVVALIFPPHSSYSRGLTEGVIDRHFKERDWMIVELPRYVIGQSPLPERRFRLDGAIVWAEPRDQYVLELVGLGVPVVNCGMEWGGRPGVMRVHLRHEDLHDEVIRHFTALGLRRAVTLGHELKQRPATLAVLKSFVKLATKAGLEASMSELGGTESPSASPRRLLEYEEETELAAWLTALPKPIGVYCCGDHMGYLVSEVARHLRLRVPEDLAIIGTGGNIVGSLAHPPLSSVAGPAREIGRVAAEQLACWLARGERPTPAVAVPGATLIQRESTVGKAGQVALEAVRRHLAENAAHGVLLSELVALSGISVKTLVQQYEEAYGIKPRDEIHVLRVAEAKRLLQESQHSVAEIASLCGFSSQASFYNYFHRHEGRSPSDFRPKPERNHTPQPTP
jgi:DNA-binding LacI/PurR family transcriptional regulator